MLSSSSSNWTAHSCPNGTVPFASANCQTDPGTLQGALCCVPFEQAFNFSTAFLKDNMPAFDLPNEESLFEGGIASLTPNVSLAAKSKYPWAATLSKSDFLDGVLPYASVNEARNNWRPFLENALSGLVMNGSNVAANLSDAATRVNDGMWTALGGITFHSEQTPLIYDPMSTIVFGYASCTGVSILYVDALRAVGIPARVAGTPAWNQVVDHGNHNWVEVLTEDGEWHFLEARPAGGGETFDNPCDKWFCNKAKFANGTKVFATAFAKSDTHYPMAWDMANHDIPGVDRTEYYQEACNKC